MGRMLALSGNGIRVGEDHQNAILTNEECERVRDLNEQGMTYQQLANKFEVSKSSIAMICRYERRACTPERWKSSKTRGYE